MDAAELLSRFASQTILVLGDVFLDEFLSGDCSRLSPEAPVPVLKVDENKTKRVLGGAANTAGKEVVVDPRSQNAAYYTGCDYITPNWKESQGLLGKPDRIVAKIPGLSTSEIRARE